MQGDMTVNHSKIQVRKFLTCILLFAILGLPETTAAQGDIFPVGYARTYTEQESRPRFDELLAQYGINKQLPEGFELQALLALSHYPQLRETKINFIVEDVSIPLSSRPHWSGMLRSAKKRIYQVIIDSQPEGSSNALLLKNQPFNAQIGIIGHELAHTAYYLQRSFFGIAADALCQLSNCRIGFERNTDKRLIDHGLGWQRLDHATFVRGRIFQDRASAFTAEGGGGAYMSPARLLQILQEHDSYKE
ncbi:MAG: hypothetical protein WDZ52_16265 [Pseudohongiellaceae bacterium]